MVARDVVHAHAKAAAVVLQRGAVVHVDALRILRPRPGLRAPESDARDVADGVARGLRDREARVALEP
eukprot:15252195-Heterocapsa_arctica.AAC.1